VNVFVVAAHARQPLDFGFKSSKVVEHASNYCITEPVQDDLVHKGAISKPLVPVAGRYLHGLLPVSLLFRERLITGGLH